MLPVLVLTAGLGTRLDPLTRVLAKPAVPLGDRTLIERVLAWLHDQGARDVVLNLHHRPATITTIVGDGAHLGLSVRYSWEQPLLGSAGGPRRAVPLLDADDFLIVNGDTLCDIDLEAMMAAHHASGADVTMAVVPNSAPQQYKGMAMGPDGIVTGFLPSGPAAIGSFHFVGVQITRARVFADLADGTPAETTAGIYPVLAATRPGSIRGYLVDRPFLDVGTPRDYLGAALAYAGAHHSADPGARLVQTIVWPDVTFGQGVGLEDAIVMGPVHVPDGFRARDSIIGPSALAHAGDTARIERGVAVWPMK